MRARGAVLGLALVAGLLSPAGTAAAANTAAAEAACPDGLARAAFADVPAEAVHAPAIDCAVWWEVARGTSAATYAPEAPVTRGQLASLVARLLRRSGGALAASPSDAFGDDTHSPHHFSINRLADAGVVAGSPSGPGRPHFRPDDPVNRGQMASFLVRAVEERTGQPLPDAPDAFHDDDDSVHEANIDRAAAAGLARGTGDGRFRAGDPVLRGQMASFLTRALEAFVGAGLVERTPGELRAASALEPFGSCDDLLSHLKERGVEAVGPYGWWYGGGRASGPVPINGGGTAEDAGGGAQPVPAAPAHSSTNNQEVGVDEPDVVKTDGATVWSLVDDQLLAVDVTGPEPTLVGTLALPAGNGGQLLVRGTRALVLGQEWDRPHGEVPGPHTPETTLTWVDLSDPAALRVEGVVRVTGVVSAGRLVDDVARVVVSSAPADLGFTYPTSGDPGATAAATQHNRLVVERSTLDDWIPRSTVEHREGGLTTATSAPLYGCDQLHRPPEHSGLGMLSVLTLDLTAPPGPGRATGLVASGETVYASPTSLYVATSHAGAWASAADLGQADPTTEVHDFSLADPAVAVYRASGKVDGLLLNQFSMSEHEGHLRVATTTGQQWGPPEAAPTESRVTVLAPREGSLVPVGQVGGLGVGERIFAVRFLGDTGHVVTFRQTDPLYTLDLSDPTAPRVVGELKIPGFSTYLHPVDDGLLLGVGQDATEDGRATGAQVSLFDVSDPAAPTRLSQLDLGADSSSEVDHDHLAFLYWPATRLAVLPLTRWTAEPGTDAGGVFVGAVGVRADPEAGLQRVAELSHGSPEWGVEGGDPRWPGIRRSLVVGDTVFTLSARGLKGSDLTTLADRSWVPFPLRSDRYR